MSKYAKHDWRCLGGGGGWEVWECRNCRYDAIPSIFGHMWADTLSHFFKRYRCTGVQEESLRMMYCPFHGEPIGPVPIKNCVTCRWEIDKSLGKFNE